MITKLSLAFILSLLAAIYEKSETNKEWLFRLAIACLLTIDILLITGNA